MAPEPPMWDLLSPATRQSVAWGALLLHTAGTLLALHALMRRRSPQGTLAWMLFLAFMPALAIPLYLVLGAGVIRRRRHRRQPPHESIARLLSLSAPWRQAALGPERSPARLTGLLPCSGNSVQLLEGSRCNYEELGRELRRAQHSILLEFFIIKNDRAGTHLRDILEERAAHGVHVCVIYDELGSYKLPLGYLHRLRKAGVHVASFNGRRYWWSSMLRLNYRNHRKLVVIDGRSALIGSLNIGIEYMHLDNAPFWRDTFVRLEGPIVAQCALCFAEDWHRATREDLSSLFAQRSVAAAGEEICQLLPSSPADAPANVWQVSLLELIGHATQRLWLASPYFVPDDAVASALQRAALRGVDVRLLLPAESDSRLAQLAMLTYLPGLMGCGVQVLAYTRGFLHEKVALVDESYCTIGTANLDERSLALNFELTLLIRGSSMAQQVAAMLARDMQHCTPMTLQAWQNAPLHRRIAAQFCRLLSPVL